MKKILSLLVVALAAGCAVGPDYESPQPLHSGSFHAAGAARQSAALPSVEEAFWQGFEDPVLEQLISQTLSSNFDLQVMLARYRAAEALLRQSRREQWPSLTAYAGAADQTLAEAERPAPDADERELYQAGASLRWEVDLFGRLARATEARRAELEASHADVQAAQVALVGQLANAYFELRGLQLQLQVTEQNVALQQSSLDIVSARFEAGRGTAFDILRARAQLDTTRAAIPELQARIRGNMHRIAVLTGSTPDTLVDPLRTTTALPLTGPAIPLATPGEVLRRRPDIRVAERRVAAATARIGVATADLFPRFTLEGLTGTLATRGDDLFTGGAETRRIAFGIDWTFLDMARVKARIDAADAEADAALAAYHQAVLLALEEVETWLVHYQQQQNRVALLGDAERAATQALEEARERYELGYIDYFELLAAELELSRARDSLVRGQADQVLAMVKVYRSLAGAPGPASPAGDGPLAANAGEGGDA